MLYVMLHVASSTLYIVVLCACAGGGGRFFRQTLFLLVLVRMIDERGLVPRRVHKLYPYLCYRRVLFNREGSCL